MFILHFILPLPIILGVFAAAWRQKWDRFTLAAVCAALALYYVHLYNTTWEQFTLDYSSHAAYVQYMAEQDVLPSVNYRAPASVVALHPLMAAARHPPGYYVMAGAMYKLAVICGVNDITDRWQVVRQLSIAYYVIFIVFGVSLIRLLMPLPTAGYGCALLLLLFWPIGVTMSGRITCDAMLYAAQAGVLYYLARWFTHHSPGALRDAFIAAGVSLLAKNTGVLMLDMDFAVLFIALWQHRRAVEAVLRRDVCMSVLFALGCYWLTMHHGWVTGGITGEETHLASHWLRSLSAFNPVLLILDTSLGDSHGMFWNMMLHSLLLGEVVQWKADNLLIAFNVCWLGVLCYLLKGLLCSYPMTQAHKNVARMLCGYALITLAAMIYMWVSTDNILYADGRYMYPIVIALALAYGKLTQCHREARRIALHRTGIALAACFVLLTLAVFSVQYY